MIRVASALVLATFALVQGSVSHAQDAGFTAVVPGDYPTIQAAVDAAPKKGHVDIRLLARTFEESVSIAGFTDITVHGDDGAAIVSRGGAPAVRATTCLNVTVAGLEIASDGVGVHFVAVARAHLDDAVIEATGSHGVLAEIGAAELPDRIDVFDRPYTVDVTNCRIDDAGGDGVRVLDRYDVEVDWSEIHRSAGDGVHVEADGRFVGVRNTVLSGVRGDGIDVTGAPEITGHVNVVTCFLRATGGDAVRLSGRALMTVRATQILGAGGGGILATGGARLDAVFNCTLQGVSGDGIRGPARGIADNTVTDPRGDGIAVEDAREVSRNVVSRAGGDGIRLDGQTGETRRGNVDRNVVDGCIGSGIHLVTAQMFKLLHNEVTGAQMFGYRLGEASSRTVLARNVARDCVVGLKVEWPSSQNRFGRGNRFGSRRPRR